MSERVYLLPENSELFLPFSLSCSFGSQSQFSQTREQHLDLCSSQCNMLMRSPVLPSLLLPLQTPPSFSTLHSASGGCPVG